MNATSESRRRDVIGAALLVAVGAGVVYLAVRYHVGTLKQMGAGFLPLVLGALLIAVGVAIAVTAGAAAETTVEPAQESGNLWHELRGWVCILGGVGAFIVFGEYGGLVPASFAAVFISALGDRGAGITRSALLAAALTAFAVAVFRYGLGIPFPLFRWG